MKQQHEYLTTKDIATKIVMCVENAVGNDSREHNRKILTRNSAPTAVWDFINTNLYKSFGGENGEAYIITRGPWQMAIIYCKGTGCVYTLMREKRFEELRNGMNRRKGLHYLDLFARIINEDLDANAPEQISMFPEETLDKEEMKRQLFKLLCSIVESVEELKRHVLVLFTSNYEIGLTAIRAVTVDRNLSIVDQADWSNLIDLNSDVVVDTVDEETSTYNTPDMGLKLTRKAELRKKTIVKIRAQDESAEG